MVKPIKSRSDAIYECIPKAYSSLSLSLCPSFAVPLGMCVYFVFGWIISLPFSVYLQLLVSVHNKNRPCIEIYHWEEKGNDSKTTPCLCRMMRECRKMYNCIQFNSTARNFYSKHQLTNTTIKACAPFKTTFDSTECIISVSDGVLCSNRDGKMR